MCSLQSQNKGADSRSGSGSGAGAIRGHAYWSLHSRCSKRKATTVKRPESTCQLENSANTKQSQDIWNHVQCPNGGLYAYRQDQQEHSSRWTALSFTTTIGLYILFSSIISHLHFFAHIVFQIPYCVNKKAFCDKKTLFLKQQIESMEVSAGVVVREGDRVKKGPKQVCELLYWTTAQNISSTINIVPQVICTLASNSDKLTFYAMSVLAATKTRGLNRRRFVAWIATNYSEQGSSSVICCTNLGVVFTSCKTNYRP